MHVLAHSKLLLRIATQEKDILPQYESDRKQKHTAVLSALQATDSAMFGCTLDTVTRPVWLDAIFEGLLELDKSLLYMCVCAWHGILWLEILIDHLFVCLFVFLSYFSCQTAGAAMRSAAYILHSVLRPNNLELGRTRILSC